MMMMMRWQPVTSRMHAGPFNLTSPLDLSILDRLKVFKCT